MTRYMSLSCYHLYRLCCSRPQKAWPKRSRAALGSFCCRSAILCLVLHAITPDMSSCCSAVMASAGKRKGLLVFCSPESPELSELRKLPPELEVVATGKTEAELSGETLHLVRVTPVSIQCICLAPGAHQQWLETLMKHFAAGLCTRIPSTAQG